MSKKLKITQKRSTIGRLVKQKGTMRALGIRKVGQTVVHEDCAAIRGMVGKVRHLVAVEEMDGEG
jgi:large subunit ribosomal protein L30